MTYNVQKAIMWLKKIAGAKYGRVLIDFSIITFLAVIIFRNWIFTSEWPADGDILCFPTLGEPFGKAIIEAMACAKPVVASSVGGPAETIQKRKTGLLSPPAQPKILGEEILNLLNNEKTAKKIGESARNAVIQHYSWDKIAEKYHKLYPSLNSS